MKYETQLALALFALSWAGASAQDPTLPVSEKFTSDNISYTDPLSKADFETALAKYDIIIANFGTSWNPHCQKLEPIWNAVTEEVDTKYPETDGRIHLARIDCVPEVDLCRDRHITGYPSLRVFRKGHDEAMNHSVQEHESYRGDRTKEALMSFVETLVPSAGRPHDRDSHTSVPSTAALLDLSTLEVMADSSFAAAEVSASDAASSVAQEASASASQVTGKAKSKGEGYISTVKSVAAKLAMKA